MFTSKKSKKRSLIAFSPKSLDNKKLQAIKGGGEDEESVPPPDE